MGLQRAAWALLVLASLAPEAIAGAVWPRLFDSTSDGVGKLVGARCEGAPAAGCTLSALEISPGRFWLEAHGPGATRIVVDFDLSSSDAAPRALLLAAASAGITSTVLRAGPAGWQDVETRPTGMRSRRRVLELVELARGDRIRIVLTREPAAAAWETRLRVEEIGLFRSGDGLARDDRPFLRHVPDRRVYHGILARACLGLAWLGVIAALFIPRPRAARVTTAFTFFLTLAATSVELCICSSSLRPTPPSSWRPLA